MAQTASEYHHGDQNISQQVESWRRFMVFSKLAALHLAVILLVLGLWFCTNAGFLGGLIPGIIVLALGLWFLRRKPSEEV
ncbi:MAG: aa3-type cytochrome c oxidase subunit IV [Caulobacteraceae bacterium]